MRKNNVKYCLKGVIYEQDQRKRKRFCTEFFHFLIDHKKPLREYIIYIALVKNKYNK